MTMHVAKAWPGHCGGAAVGSGSFCTSHHTDMVTTCMTNAERIGGAVCKSLLGLHHVDPASHYALACAAGPRHNCWVPAGLLLSPSRFVSLGNERNQKIPGFGAAWKLQEGQGCRKLQPI